MCWISSMRPSGHISVEGASNGNMQAHRACPLPLQLSRVSGTLGVKEFKRGSTRQQHLSNAMIAHTRG